MNISGAFSLENYFSLEEIIELENNKNHGFTYIRPENYMKTENYNAEFKKSIYQAYYIFFKLTIYYLLIAPQKLFQKAKIKNME